MNQPSVLYQATDVKSIECAFDNINMTGSSLNRMYILLKLSGKIFNGKI